MDTSLVLLVTVAIVTFGITFLIAHVLHRRKIDRFNNLTSAIQDTEQRLADRRKELKTLQQEYEAQASQITEQVFELNSRAEKKKSKVDAALRALDKLEAEAADKRNDLTSDLQQIENDVQQKKRKLEQVEQRTEELLVLEARGTDIRAALNRDTKTQDSLRTDIQAMEDNLHDLKSELDLYTRIEDFVDFGFFETPGYLHETPERYVAEIRRIRNRQKELIKGDRAVELAEGIEINGSSKTASALLSGQAKLMLRTFNVECDYLIGKLNPSNFDRTLEKIEKIAEGLEKMSVSLANGISMPYIDLKFEECRLVFEHKLKKAEQDEEQRLIREQMREEQRAIKEYERAIAAAEKEERIYRDLLDKAKKQLQSAHEGEKTDLEIRILSLEAQLKEAQEKEERAKSMAEQTRRGHVYVISNIGSFGDQVYKIGLTRRLDPLDRVRELGDASVPFLFDVHAIIYSEDAPALESALHQRFDRARINAVNRRKEFFRVPLDEIKTAVYEIAGDTAEFRTTAVAEEYYETRRLQGSSA